MRGTFRAALILVGVALAFGGVALAEDQNPPPPASQFDPLAANLPPGVVHYQVQIEDTEEGYVEMPRPQDPNTMLGASGRAIGSDLTTPGSGLPLVGGAVVGARGGGGDIPRIQKTEREIKTVIKKLG